MNGNALSLFPVSLREANAFVEQHHRHHKGVAGHKFSIGCIQDGQLVGVAIIGRPVSRYLDNGLTLEVNRLCTIRSRKCLQYALCGGGTGGEGNGLSEDHHLHAGHGTGNKPPGRWLDVYGTGWRRTLDGRAPSRRRPVSAANETAV